MNFMGMYFSPSGRINRSTFWLQGVLSPPSLYGLPYGYYGSNSQGWENSSVQWLSLDFDGVGYAWDRGAGECVIN